MVLIAFLTIASRALFGLSPVPGDLFEVVIALGPAATAMGTLSFSAKFVWGAERKDKVIVKSTILMALTAVIFCGLLTTSQQWLTHLFLMMALFAVFLVWDRFILIKNPDAVSDDERRRILSGHRLVNWPTVIAICGGLIFLLFLSESDSLGSLTQYFVQDTFAQCYDEHVINCIKVSDAVDAYITAFVHGLTTFHLFASATAYYISPLILRGYGQSPGSS